jgi:hypothetical protein
MYACIDETGGGFFASVCGPNHHSLFSCDPPPMSSEKAGALQKGSGSMRK